MGLKENDYIVENKRKNFYIYSLKYYYSSNQTMLLVPSVWMKPIEDYRRVGQIVDGKIA